MCMHAGEDMHAYQSEHVCKYVKIAPEDLNPHNHQ